MTRLTHTTVTTQLLPKQGRSITSSRNRHLLVDAPLVLGGPNEEMNPYDLMLSALTSHAVFICERAARQANIPLIAAHMTANIHFDPLGVIGEPVCPDFQGLQLHLTLSGPNEQQAEILTQAIQTRCPIYVTLLRAMPISLEVATTATASA